MYTALRLLPLQFRLAWVPCRVRLPARQRGLLGPTSGLQRPRRHVNPEEVLGDVHAAGLRWHPKGGPRLVRQVRLHQSRTP